MKSLSGVIDYELAWTKSGCRDPEHELRAAGKVVARLRWQGDSFVLAEIADGRWSFERPVLRRSPVSVRAVESGAEIATFGSGWAGGGTLETSRGRRFAWSAANFWR